jgi:Fe-S-cluster containining protein
MTEAEAKTIAEKIGITWEAFIDNYLDSRWPGIETVVIRQIASVCPFLDQPADSIIGLCRIHACKPSCCQWQANLDRNECRQGLNRYWGLSVSEDGELNGSPEDILCFQTYIESLNEEEDV